MKFSNESQCIIYWTHLGIAQSMLDYDFLCERWPSVAAIFSPWGTQRQHKVFYGDQEFFLPTITTWEACKAFPNADTLINLASFRSSTEVNKAALATQQFANIFTIAEWVPERETRELIALTEKQDKTTLFGPSIVGWLISTVFKIGHTWWSIENILASRLYQAGSIGIVSKSWGMMNELCRMISKTTDGVHTALQIGWDRFPMTWFVDIITYYQQQDDIRMIVLLGEVGNKEELRIAEMIADGTITKPVVARCIGHAAEQLPAEIQFGHAGAKANSKEESASYKNTKLREAGAFVPASFDQFGWLVQSVFAEQFGFAPEKLTHTEHPQIIRNKCALLQKRKKTNFTSTISNEKDSELTYNEVPISQLVQDNSIGKVIGHLRLKKELPDYACDFLTTALILLADHGPAVAGATNTIVTARAGKDLVSSLIAWLATIGPRFGGAIDGAAQWLFTAVRDWKSPTEVIAEHKQAWRYIQWIGHKVKSKYDPDKRCTILTTIAEDFPSTNYFTFAKEVEAITLEKKPSLILNVDGHIAALLLDMLTDIGLSQSDIEAYIEAGLFNGLFVLARSIWFIGHYLDQNRLQEWLYRTPRSDISYGKGEPQV